MKDNTFWIILYIVGVIIAYILVRKSFKDDIKNKYVGTVYAWKDVLMIFFFSIFSWAMVFIAGIILIADNHSSEPPNWL